MYRGGFPVEAMWRRGNTLAGSRGGRSLAFVEKVATHLPDGRGAVGIVCAVGRHGYITVERHYELREEEQGLR